MTASVSLAGQRLAARSSPAARRRATGEIDDGRTDEAGGHHVQDLRLSRTGTGRLFYTARLQYASIILDGVVNRGIRIERRYQKVTRDGLEASATTFADGDLIRVTLTVSPAARRKILAFTDPLPAGFEAVTAR
jgi:uncharacterized protein YfaS (alpha-2-macroglobulin family)